MAAIDNGNRIYSFFKVFGLLVGKMAGFMNFRFLKISSTLVLLVPSKGKMPTLTWFSKIKTSFLDIDLKYMNYFMKRRRPVSDTLHCKENLVWT